MILDLLFLEKACIKVLEACTIDGVSFKKDDKIDVQFNPEKYSIKTSVRYSFNAVKDTMHRQYGGRQSRTLSLELFYDMITEETIFKKAKKLGSAVANIKDTGAAGLLTAMFEADAVNEAYINKIMVLTKANPEKSRPPMVEFAWGNEKFKGVITDASQEYVLFNRKGSPTRANISLTLSECDDVLEGKQAATVVTPPSENKSGDTGKEQGASMLEEEVKSELLQNIPIK